VIAFSLGILMVVVGAIAIVRAIRALPRLGASPEGCDSAIACERGCAEGRPADCRRAGLFHLQGLGVARSPERARGFLRSACDGGDASGCTALGAVLLEGGGPADAAEVRAAFQKGCEAGDAMGCNNLANLYDEGPDRDPGRARALYQKACDQGSGMACSTLAKALQAGSDGIAKDPARARALFSRSARLLQESCDGGSARACGQAGWLHERGLGVPADLDRARHDYRIGCDGNDGASCYNLAVVRRQENAADPSVQALIARACTLGLPEACAAIKN
jgi:TPR repeat protein